MDELIEAFEAYQEAKKVYNDRAKHIQYDKDWALYDEQQEINRTKEILSKCFEKAVLAVVEKQGKC